MEMREERNDKTLTISLSGAVDSTNYEDVERETDACIEKDNSFESLCFNVADVNYVSSAGLRMFSHFNQKMKHEGKGYSIIKASKELYKIFNITGYTSAFTVQMADD